MAHRQPTRRRTASRTGELGASTAFLAIALAAATAAAGPDTEPCDSDPDGDCIFSSVDNCRDTPNVSQVDTDQDGQGDLCDNCLHVPNGPFAGPYPGRTPNTGVSTPGLQCDTDADGYGNACDPDLDNNGFALAGDFSLLFQPAVLAGPFVFVANDPANGKTTPQSQEADQDCNNFILSNDFSLFFQPGIVLGPVMAGRSGIATGPPGCCPPHN